MKINIVAHSNSKHPRIETDLLGLLHVYVTQPPLEGKANKAVTQALADYFGIHRNLVVLLSGERSRHKLFEIINS